MKKKKLFQNSEVQNNKIGESKKNKEKEIFNERLFILICFIIGILLFLYMLFKGVPGHDYYPGKP